MGLVTKQIKCICSIFDPTNIKPIILNHFPMERFQYIYETVKNIHYTHKGYYVLYKKKKKGNIKPTEKWER